MNIIFLGYNSFKDFKRGVENVILFQSNSFPFLNRYYLHWGDETLVYKYNNIICISIKHCFYWPIILNILLIKLKRNSSTRVIIHSHNPLFTFFSIYRTSILTVHDGLYYLANFSKNKFAILLQLVEKVVYRKSNKVHFISNFTKKNSLFSLFDKFVIIPNSTILQKYLFKEASIPANNFKILVVKSIETRARFDLILELALRLTSYNITVAGKGPLLDFYSKLAKVRGITNLKFLGFVSDKNLADLYNDTFIVINLAEFGEGFGLPIIEAYMFNRPVIASNNCAIPEVIIDKSFLTENNVEDIIYKIEYVRESFNKFNYASFYSANFSNDVISRKYFDLYIGSK